jgi:hypothetical protein
MLTLTAVLLVFAQTGTPTQRNTQSVPVLQVGVFSYGPDGKSQAAAYDTTLASDSFEYIAGCEIGGGNRPVPDKATDAWRVSGKVESMNAEEAVVRVDWQRVRAAGVGVTSPGGSIQLTLHPGDRVPLDSAHPDPSVGCGGRTVAFEARFGPRPGFMIGPGGALSESPAVTIMRGREGVASVDAAKNEPAPRSFTADLWLVKKDDAHPDRAEFNTQGLVVQAVRGSADFAFSPFVVDTSAGPLTIQVSGILRSINKEGSVRLLCSVMRNIRYSTDDANRKSGGTMTGTSTIENGMPRPEDVLSFELPPISVPNTTTTLPEQYSVRLRIR